MGAQYRRIIGDVMLRRWLIIFTVSIHVSLISYTQGAAAPTLTRQPNIREVTFRDSRISDADSDASVELVCEATGDPMPKYEWYKDGRLIDLTKRVRHSWSQLGSGTVRLSDLTVEDEGVYQCKASNSFGTAISNTVHLRSAVLNAFRTESPKTHYPVLGTSLTLICDPPHSFPPPVISWGVTKLSSVVVYRDIVETERVALDYQGNVHIANVMSSDELGAGYCYVCSVFNELMRRAVQGSDHYVKPLSLAGAPSYSAPHLMWSSPTNDVAVVGTVEKKIKCIFAGYPTPSVTWTKVDEGSRSGDGLLPAGVTVSPHGLELTIHNVNQSHRGSYKCTASNDEQGAKAFAIINITVEYAPGWMKELRDLTVVEEDEAVFECVAVGHPVPIIHWLINGVPVEHLTPNERRREIKDRLIFERVTKEDSQVIQCNASNTHGYLLSNAHLYVLAEPPTFSQRPEAERKVVVGETVLLDCKGSGLPEPRILWTRGQLSDLLTGRRFVQHSNGTLEIKNVREKDDGLFKCVAANKFGNNTAESYLRVRKRTTITGLPARQIVNASDPVELNCEVISDAKSLRVEWSVNGQPLDTVLSERITYDPLNRRVTIHKAEVRDSGNYTCHAASDINSDTISTQLIVRDRPDPPTDVKLVSCVTSSAEIFWTPGNSNNADIIDYTVYYNTSHNALTHKVNVTAVPFARISTRPWMNYTFHVTARNAMGVSDPSEGTPGMCTTPQTRPYRNPRGVCVRGGSEVGQILVQWQPLSDMERNGEDFYYEIQYKLEGVKDKPSSVRVDDWKQSELVIDGLEVYKRYEVNVRSVNAQGHARGKLSKNKHVGYSSEGVPDLRPDQFNVVTESVTSNSARFNWRPVNTDVRNIRGFFTGYQIQFWRTGRPDDIKTENITLRERPDECLHVRDLMDDSREEGGVRKRRQAQNLVSGTTNKLWPASHITAGVAVMNSARVGPISDTVAFNTPEGVPDQVESFRVIERGSHHFTVSWLPPLETNGNLTHYILAIQSRERGRYEKVELDVSDTKEKLHGLDPNTEYTLSIEAYTLAGAGPISRVTDHTLPISSPDQPVIEELIPGDDYIIVYWRSSDQEPPINPATFYYVDHRMEGTENFTRMAVHKDENVANVSGLDWGIRYEFIVTGVNGEGMETASDSKSQIVGLRPGETRLRSASVGWFIILMTLIALLLLILLIICCLKCGRQGKYPVQEKERLHGYNSDSEPPFGEYNTGPMGRCGSTESDVKPLGSETDSLDEYDDTDPNKFNEDGSFIGIYGSGRRTAPDYDPNATYTTFI